MTAGTPMDLAINTLVTLIDRDTAAYLEACVHCGQCAQACPFYEATEDDRFTPSWKLEPLQRVYRRHVAPFSGLKRRLGLAPAELTRQDFTDFADLIYDSCTLCGRCTVVCPMGIDIATLVRRSRAAWVAVGLEPEDMRAAANRAVETGSPLAITPEILRKHCAAQEKETGVPVPIDVKGAEYMLTLSAMEVLNFYEIIGAVARIMHKAGVSWTISTKGYEATNIGYQMGDREVAATLVGRLVEAAEELEVRCILTPECGHAYAALKWDGPNLLGRTFTVEVMHLVELVERLLRAGRLPIKDKDGRRLTFHDPCQIVRRGGVVEPPRTLMHAVSETFIETENPGVANLCCGGGGGVSTNSRAEPLRLAAFLGKRRQFEAVAPDAVVTACANCRNVLEEALEHTGWDLPVVGLTELVAEHLEE